jgi:hypothetical protein
LNQPILYELLFVHGDVFDDRILSSAKPTLAFLQMLMTLLFPQSFIICAFISSGDWAFAANEKE